MAGYEWSPTFFISNMDRTSFQKQQFVPEVTVAMVIKAM